MQSLDLCLSREGESTTFLGNLFTDLCIPPDFIQNRSFTEVTSIFTSSLTDLRWENMMTASLFEEVNSQLGRQRSLRQIHY